ncbi:GntR family transcriptional regulator [Oceanotoga teriensis]|uniref:DNA-binding transcriptional regulator YhcF (GntR family) n=1 Tax=Oceanotoga teriensis TaxID=515440 RepID=A0AA45C6R6_9BACT|nr:GntR family transcriptional regulator [Oceanotoga teriensis]MDO7977231.1 GntR family transcriptional regulator [Oceanotoga teriensis]PWJ93221.1 DNA-binding transcriptional regulator YhcF (GntR family) [Oceanotoga teriensis]
MIKIKINYSSNTPLFIQIAQAIEDDIISGIYKEDEMIISTTQLSKLLNINPTTAVKAVGLLNEENILYKKRGVGMFVSKGALEIIMEKRKNEFFNKKVKEFLDEAFKIGLNTNQIIEILRKESENRK